MAFGTRVMKALPVGKLAWQNDVEDTGQNLLELCGVA